MFNSIKVKGIITANPENLTKKHEDQSSWKRVAFIDFGITDICKYYAWFLKKKYNLDLQRGIRNPHVTIVNDKVENFSGLDLNEKESNWNNFCEKYNGMEMTINLDVFTKGNARHYWLNVSEDSRREIMVMRNELGLDRPFSGLHMTIGRVKDLDLKYSDYILSLLIK